MNLLNTEQTAFFESEGYLILENFFSVAAEIEPILQSIHGIILRVADRHGIELTDREFSVDRFDTGYQELLKLDRRFAAEVYDLVKQSPPFMRLICNERSDGLFQEIRGGCLSGIGANSYGIRIDNPFEEKFRSHWHQEFMFQPQSMNGIVFWTPLVPVTQDLGPVVVLPRSHKDGLCVYSRTDDYAAKQGAYKIGLHDEASVIGKYEQIAPFTKPGDLLLMDFLTLHSSGVNRSERSRWSIQHRFFSFDEPVGQKIGWKASITTGVKVEEIFPNNFV